MFFERPDSGERAILVHIELSADSDNEDPRELEELALSAGADPVEFLTGSRAEPSPKFFLGAGKVEELSALVQQHQAELVIFNHALSPAQERNLEREIQCRVLDRTGLILDIFAQRPEPTKANCRWSWPSSSTCPLDWCAAGPTWSDRRGG